MFDNCTNKFAKSRAYEEHWMLECVIYIDKLIVFFIDKWFNSHFRWISILTVESYNLLIINVFNNQHFALKIYKCNIILLNIFNFFNFLLINDINLGQFFFLLCTVKYIFLQNKLFAFAIFFSLKMQFLFYYIYDVIVVDYSYRRHTFTWEGSGITTRH